MVGAAAMPEAAGKQARRAEQLAELWAEALEATPSALGYQLTSGCLWRAVSEKAEKLAAKVQRDTKEKELIDAAVCAIEAAANAETQKSYTGVKKKYTHS